MSILGRSRWVSMLLLYIVPSHNIDTRYFHQGYQAGHLVQEQVYGPPGSEHHRE
jgi:hypothetical protein